MHRLLRQQALDFGETVGALDRPADSGELLLGVVKVPVEELVHKLRRVLVQARDGKDESRGDQHPRPFGQLRQFVDGAHFFMDEVGRHAEQQSQRSRAAERDPDADHSRPAHRLHHEQA